MTLAPQGKSNSKGETNKYFSVKKPLIVNLKDLPELPSIEGPKKPYAKGQLKKLLTIADDNEHNQCDKSSQFSECLIVNKKELNQTPKKIRIVSKRPLFEILKPINLSKNVNKIISLTEKATDYEKNNLSTFLTGLPDEFFDKMKNNIEKYNKKKGITNFLLQETKSKNQNISNKAINMKNKKGNNDLASVPRKFKTYYDKSMINFKSPKGCSNEKNSNIDTDQSLLCSPRTTTNSSTSQFRSSLGDNENFFSSKANNKSKITEFRKEIPRLPVDNLGERRSPISERPATERPLETIFEKMKPGFSPKNTMKLLNKISSLGKNKRNILLNSYAPCSSSNEKKTNLSIADKSPNKFGIQSDDDERMNQNRMKPSRKSINKGFLIKRHIKINVKTEMSLPLNKSSVRL